MNKKQMLEIITEKRFLEQARKLSKERKEVKSNLLTFQQVKILTLNIFTLLKNILPFRIFEQLALTLENRAALKVFTVLNILFTFRIFEQLALALKVFTIQDF